MNTESLNNESSNPLYGSPLREKRGKKFQARWPEVARLSKLVESQPLSTISPERKEISDTLIASAKSFKHVSRFAGDRYFGIRIYLGGVNVIVGAVIVSDRERAIRVADMATLYFWKYRVYEEHIRGSEFNISPASAEEDLKNHPLVAYIFKQIEDYLRSPGTGTDGKPLLLSDSELEAGKKARKNRSHSPIYSSSRDAILRLAAAFDQELMSDFFSRILSIESRTGKLESRIANLESQNAEIKNRLSEIENKLISIANGVHFLVQKNDKT
jgi:hypothetical protein